jgi:hypothetical protein
MAINGLSIKGALLKVVEPQPLIEPARRGEGKVKRKKEKLKSKKAESR